jgi:glycosyltransferase involved in cell wall biosynthesis
VQRLLRLCCDRPNCRTVFQNFEDRETYERARIVRRDHTVLIPGSGVDLDMFQPSVQPDGVPVVVLPARMIYHKGVGEFVGAARLLRDRNVSARFALVGPLDPDNESAIPAEVLKAWLAEGVVEWWGKREDMAHVFAEASVVCLPSYREGMSKALMEAAAAGRPVVTTDVPGCRECVEPGRTGVLVPVRDVTALAAALEVLLRDAPLRAALGAQGRGLAERAFGVRQVIDRHIELYRGLLGR